MRRRIAVWLVVVALTPWLSGCGGGGEVKEIKPPDHSPASAGKTATSRQAVPTD